MIVLFLLASLQEPPAAFSRTILTAGTDDTIRFDGERDDDGGDVGVFQTKLSLEAMHLEGFEDIIRLSGAVERAWYDFEDSEEIEDVYAFRTDASWVHRFNPEWAGVLYGALRADWEAGADVDEALGGSLGAGGWVDVSDDLSLGMMLLVRFLIEDTPQIWPLPYIDWKLDDRLHVKTEQKAGFGYTLSYGLDDPREDGSYPWSVDGRLRLQTRRIRHDDHGFNPEGILEDLRTTVDVLVRHEPAPGLSLGLYAGVEAWQLYEVEDTRGHKIDKFNTYAKPVIGIDLRWKF